jgi:hypothetical protein
MNAFVLLLRNESIDFSSYSPEDMQEIMSDFDAWNQSMISEGRLIVSGSLQGGKGKTIRKGPNVTDGPYSESKEAIQGFLLVHAEDYEKAAVIGAGCPFVSRGGSVEVRMVPQLDFEDAALPIVNEHMKARSQKRKGE